MAAKSAAALEKWRREAVEQIQSTRRSTLALVARIPEAELRRPRTQDEWSVKDMLGHLTSCDEETVRRFKLLARGRADRILWFNMAIANEFNARTVAQKRRLGLAALLRRMAKAHAEVVDWLQRLPVESLEDPSHAYTVVSWLPVPGWRHEQHHMGDVKVWWQSRQKAPAQRSLKPPKSKRR